MFTCRAQSDSLQEHLMLVVLGKEDGKVGGGGGGCECDNKGRKTWMRERGKEGEEIS